MFYNDEYYYYYLLLIDYITTLPTKHYKHHHPRRHALQHSWTLTLQGQKIVNKRIILFTKQTPLSSSDEDFEYLTTHEEVCPIFCHLFHFFTMMKLSVVDLLQLEK